MEPMKELSDGPLHAFATWPNAAVPRIAIGCYSIWRDEQPQVGHIAAEFESLANVLLGRGCGNPAFITYPLRCYCCSISSSVVAL